ncbi:MAG: hypothetical protein FJ249_01685 [Nitrospira sp.]|nr:hypothetical protein [Nitrospira sp.]
MAVKSVEGSSAMDSDVRNIVPIELAPIYSTRTINEPIGLYEGTLELSQGNRKLAGSGKIQFEWQPSPGLTFNLFSQECLTIEPDESLLNVAALDVPIKTLVTHVNVGTSASGILNSPVQIGEGKNLQFILFHVVNFWPYLGHSISNLSGTRYRSARQLV